MFLKTPFFFLTKPLNVKLNKCNRGMKGHCSVSAQDSNAELVAGANLL